MITLKKTRANIKPSSKSSEAQLAAPFQNLRSNSGGKPKRRRHGRGRTDSGSLHLLVAIGGK